MAQPRTKQPTAKERAATAKDKAETAYYEAQARKIGMEADEYERQSALVRASEHENRIYSFDASVSSGSVQQCIMYLGQWVRRDRNQPIQIIFNSPGGSVFEGLALFDFIQQLRAGGTRVDTASIGMAASMGGVLLQAGEERAMSPSSYMLIHEVSDIAMGKTSELEDELRFTKRLQQRLLDILAERSTMTARQIASKWKKTDWWLDATAALELGFVDVIR